ncbi:MAG: Pycsar system effector family protein [Patescibacteria group bacterium]
MDPNAINFLRDSLAHHHNLRNSLDGKASFLLAIAGVVFGLSVIRLEKVQFVVIAITAFLTILLTVFAVFLPYRGKMKEKIGLMCWWGFAGKSYESYQEEVNRVIKTDEAIADEYKKEIWNLANYSLRPKSVLLKWASFVLTVGLLAGFVLFFV